MLIKLLWPLLLCTSMGAQERREFVIANFKTESGGTLPSARVVYGTYGKLNADKSNAILLPSHYMANYRGYAWLIGPGKALNPNDPFWVCSELFGNGSSFVAEQYSGALSWPALPCDDDPRQRGSGS